MRWEAADEASGLGGTGDPRGKGKRPLSLPRRGLRHRLDKSRLKQKEDYGPHAPFSIQNMRALHNPVQFVKIGANFLV